MLPYVLAQYEASLPGDPVPETTQLTIDHVMPQTLGAKWEGVSKSDHDRLKDTWANLIPLSGPRNSSKGNQHWSAVSGRLGRESIWKTPRRLAHDYPTWDVESIEKRAKVLAAWAVGRWPRRA